MALSFLLLAACSIGPQLTARFQPGVDSGLGVAVLTLSDIDGDGVSDFASGAPGSPAGGVPGAGRVIVYSGATRAVLDEWTSQHDLGFGRSLRALDDVNGDGVPDVLVGYDRRHGVTRTDVRCGLTGRPIQTFEHAADDVIPLGDANLDGEPDLLVTEDAAWRIVGAQSGLTLGVLAPNPPPALASRSSRRYAVQTGAFWPVGDLDGDGVMDGILPGLEPQLLRSDRSAAVDGQVRLYPESRRVPLGGVVAEFFAGLEPVIWKADPAGDLNADGVADFFLGVLEESRSSTLLGVSGAEFRTTDPSPRILNFHPALDGGILNEYRHFAEDLFPVGNIDDVPGDDLVCLGHPEAPSVKLYALPGLGGEPLWDLEPARTHYHPRRASFTRFDDVDSDGCREVLVGTTRYDGPSRSTSYGGIHLVSPGTGRVFWRLHSHWSSNTEQFLAATLFQRPLLVIQGDRDSQRQLGVVDSCALRQAIPNLMVLHVTRGDTQALGEPGAPLPEADSFRSAYHMGPAHDGFEMVLVGDDGRLVKRYGVVTEPEAILRDYHRARASWERERAFVMAAAERGPILVVRGNARWKASWTHQLELLQNGSSALLERDVAVISPGDPVQACRVGDRKRIPDAEYFERRYPMKQRAPTFELLLIAPDGRLVKRYSSPVAWERLVEAIDTHVPSGRR
ncbi:MAG: hypothetical protein ACJAQ3_001508 [Planctomycetota bacterium]|jgi:hypothetical protein